MEMRAVTAKTARSGRRRRFRAKEKRNEDEKMSSVQTLSQEEVKTMMQMEVGVKENGEMGETPMLRRQMMTCLMG